MSRTAARPGQAGSPPLEIRSPVVISGGFEAGLEAAQSGLEPVAVPVSTFADDRGWSFMNMLQGVLTTKGQVNFSVQYPGVVKAWHRHDRQTDFWCCLQGNLKVGVYRERDHVAWLHVMGEKRPSILVIPPPLWHGATAIGGAPAGLLYYVTHAYDPDSPDEHRRAWDDIAEFPWGMRHG